MKKRKWSKEQRAKHADTIRRRKRYFRKGGALMPNPDFKPMADASNVRDAITFLKKMEIEIAKRMSLERARRIDRASLYGLLALDALTGETL